ncbi:hypothetical protein INS49_003095 [Diaporthe citri]|uniref:uncharacterized protein n=1 Tax=Diaporthe citri TaxID=83186 RepID=UPI001C82743D|nr:uncharacterized protein INS49_003095 [Diaporthe citri]KAG6368877.1 hypothetical protein INS49_003095 [Diaporthe citri]
MATALSAEVQLMRRRVRHIHIPDLPPRYAPRGLAPNIRDHIDAQITHQRALQEEPPRPEAKHGFARVASNVPTSFTSWVKRAGPPPTVLSFTRRPTYILPKHQVERQEPWQVEYLMKALKSRMNVHFPEPPAWSSLPWRPFWEREMAESGWKHDPLNHQWTDVGVLIMPCAEAMFLGPGQVSIWPIIDLKDDIQRGSVTIKTKYEFERILEDTTIELLKREFGIQAFAIPGSTGVWVESRIPPPEFDQERSEGDDIVSRPESLDAANRRANVRRIATVHTSFTDDITQWGVSIHVGQPDPTLESWTNSTNPWTPIRQHNTTTSIAAELAHMKSSASPLGPSKYLSTYYNQNAMPASAGQGAMPYSLIKTGSGRRSPAPLGMDNRDISTAWTYEFARQLGIKDGHVDHYSMVEADDRYATDLPTKTSGAGFRFRGVYSEDVMNSTYRQVDVPHILVGKHEKVHPGIVEESMRIEHKDGRIDSVTHDGWLLSWPLWGMTLTRKLDEAICGGPSDTRRKVYEMQKQASSRLQRRRNELKQVKEVEDAWRADMPHLVRRPLSDEIVRELADRSREMETILKTVRMGTKSAKLLDSTIQIRRLLEKRFAGAFSRNAGTTESARSTSSTRKEISKRAPGPMQPADPASRSKIRPSESLPNQSEKGRNSLGVSEGESSTMPPRQVKFEEPADITGTKAEQHTDKLPERGREPVKLGLHARTLVNFTKTRAEKDQDAVMRRLDLGKKPRDAENDEPGQERRPTDSSGETKKRREAAGGKEQASWTPKDAGEGTRAGPRTAARASPYLPSTHQVGGF